MPRNYVRKIKAGRPRKPPKTRDREGRPEKHSPQLFARIVSLARVGWTMDAISKMCEIHIDTIYDWRQKFPEFSEKLKEAKTYFDEKGADGLDFLMSKQKLKKRKIIKTIDENGKEVTKTEIVEEEIAPNAQIIALHASRRAPHLAEKKDGGFSAKETFIAAFEQWTNTGAIERYRGQELPREPAIGQAADELVSEQGEDQCLGGGSPFR